MQYRVITENEVPNTEVGWYVVGEDNNVYSGPHDFLWQANQAKKQIERIEASVSPEQRE